MIESLGQRIEEHIYLQSVCLQNLDHVFDILESLDIITVSEEFRIDDVRESCARYVKKNLESISELDELLKERPNISSDNIVMLRSILFKNLLCELEPKDDKQKNVKEELGLLAHDFQKSGGLDYFFD